MSTAAVTPDQDIETVQHPTLGPLKFPKSMPFDERNSAIERLEQGSKSPSVGHQIVSGIGSAVGGMIKGIPEGLKAQASETGNFMRQHPIISAVAPGVATLAGAYKGLIANPSVQARQSVDARPDVYGPGTNHSAAVAKGIASVPIVGPMEINAELKATGNPGAGVPAKPWEAASELGTYAAAPELLGRGVGSIGGRMAAKAPEVYKSALKPSTSMSIGETDRLVNTGLQNKIPISKGGLAKSGAMVDDINGQIADKINERPDAPISTPAVASRIDQIKPKFSTQVNPADDLRNLDASKKEFLQQHTVAQPYTKIDFRPVDGGEVGAVPVGKGTVNRLNDIPAAEAQQIKQGTYKQIGSKAYGELKTASVEGQKALARGIKEELAKEFPELTNLNAREGALIELNEAIQRAVQRTSNNEPIGIQTPLIGAGAKAMTNSNAAAVTLGGASAFMRSPLIRSKLAIALHQAGVPDAAVASRLAAIGGAASSNAQSENRPTK